MQVDYEILMRLLLAALWGGMVGMEREYRSKSAGFRTMILISMGSCFFTIMSEAIGSPSNADRIASNIITGIGFLGAGVIFRGENRVTGITTAASIWAVAAIGMGIGAGYYFAAIAASFLIFIVLAILPYIERQIDHINLIRTYAIGCHITKNGETRHEKMLTDFHLKFEKTAQIKKEDMVTTTWVVRGKAKNHALFTAALLDDADTPFFEF